jgi:hypothetical protein
VLLRFALLLSLTPVAHADVFLIEFTPVTDYFLQSEETLLAPNHFTSQLTGSFTTDGVCTICAISQTDGSAVVSNGILGALIMNGPGLELDLNNPQLFSSEMTGEAKFNRSTGAFSISGHNVGDGYGASTDGTTGSYRADFTGTVIETGTFSISAAPVPEPASGRLLLTILIVAIAALKRRPDLHSPAHGIRSKSGPGRLGNVRPLAKTFREE